MRSFGPPDDGSSASVTGQDEGQGTKDQGRSGLLAALKQTTFRSLRHRNYRRYFFGQIVSFTGSWMQSAALMWLMYDRTGDPRWPSWLLVAQVGPTVLLGTFGGHLADRLPKRRLVLRTQSVFLVNAVILTALVAADAAVPALILALQVITGVVQAVDLPARLAFVPDLVPREDLINAVGLNSLVFNSARAVGPAAAGLLFLAADAAVPLFPPGVNGVTLGAIGCFGLNAISFVAVLIALRGIRVPGEGTHGSETAGGSVWDGVRYLLDRSALGGLVLLTLVLCVFGWPVLTLLPAYTRVRLGLAEQSYSLLVTGLGAGALVSALATATFGSAARRAGFLVAGAAATAAGIAGLSAVDTLPAAIGCAACVGFGLILFLSTGQSTLQLAVPDGKRGRVMALWAMTLSASAPLGHLLAGQAAAEIGVVPVLRVMAAGAGVVAVGLAVLLAGRRWRRPG
ncbi:MAG: enterobactin exporter EntS [Gemmataceae bacterium]|nr:enterobactin exporter EntS [Gemmataceae bacterium]